MAFAYIKNAFVDESAAVIFTAERGFRFGDGVFETVAVYNGAMYQWPLHRARLEQGLAALRIPYDTSALDTLCRELMARNELREGFVRLSVSRGIGSEGYLPRPECTPTLIIETQERAPIGKQPITLWLSGYRKPAADALPVQAKLMQGVNSTLARMEAQEHGCFEALQLNAKGEICEGSSANIFWFRSGKLYTPSPECGLLPGTTRAAIIRLSPYPVEEGFYTPDDLRHAEAVFLTNIAWQVMPVAGLQPNCFTWNNLNVAHEFQTLLETDIAQCST